MSEESKIFGVSFRGWIAFIIVSTVCLMSSNGLKVDEPLYTLCTVAVGFYFGSKSKPEQSDNNKGV